MKDEQRIKLRKVCDTVFVCVNEMWRLRLTSDRRWREYKWGWTAPAIFRGPSPKSLSRLRCGKSVSFTLPCRLMHSSSTSRGEGEKARSKIVSLWKCLCSYVDIRDLKTWESGHHYLNRSLSLSGAQSAGDPPPPLSFLSLSVSLVSEEWHSWTISLQNRKWVWGQKWLGAGENITSPMPECFGGSFVAWHCVKHMWDSSPYTSESRSSIFWLRYLTPTLRKQPDSQALGDFRQTVNCRNQNCNADLIITVCWMGLCVFYSMNVLSRRRIRQLVIAGKGKLTDSSRKGKRYSPSKSQPWRLIQSIVV